MGKILIRDPDGKNSDPGSGINILDPQHCVFDNISFFTGHRNRYIIKGDPGSGSIRQDYESADPGLKEMFMSTTLVPMYFH